MEITERSNASVSCLSLEMEQSTCWDSLVPVDANVGFNEKATTHHHSTFYPLNAVALEHQPNVNVVHHFPSSPLVGPTRSIPCLLNAAYPDNVKNFCPVESSTTVSTVSPAVYPLGTPNQCCSVNPSLKNARSRIRASARECDGVDYGAADLKEEQSVTNRVLKSPADGKKRMRIPDCLVLDSNSNFNKTQRIESDQSKDGSKFSNDSTKMKTEPDTFDDLSKSNARQAQDQSQNFDAPKENYIHVRARRGQATNSHSLAERIRREKISERMRLLQDLVPGCDKVTGKAVMLDEIINYVQSLQRQVEFLSMKLATVVPRIDVEEALLKDMLHSDGSTSDALGFTYNTNSTYPINGYSLEPIESGTDVMQCLKNYGDTLKSPMNSELFQMDQVSNTCNDELQGIVQMGYISPAQRDILEKNDSLNVGK